MLHVVATNFAGGGDAPLRRDPRWQAETLETGVRCLVRRNEHPAGGMILRLRVDAGSLSESGGQGGEAFLTAMALHAAAAESKLGRALASLGEGLAAGARSIDVAVHQDSATFTVALPIAEEKATVIGLRYLASIARGVGLDEASVLRFRPQIRARRSEMLTKRDRLLSAVLPQIAPGSRIASHPAIPGDAALCALSPDDLTRFHARRYAPGRLTVIAVGDAPAAGVMDWIRKEFQSLPIAEGANMEAVEEEVAQGPEAEHGPRAAVAADPGLRQAVAEVVSVHPWTGAARTVADWRGAMLDWAAVKVLEARIGALVERADSKVRGGGVRIGFAPGPAMAAIVSVWGDADDWRVLIGCATEIVAGARAHEPTPDEVSAAREAIISDLGEAVARNSERESAWLIDAATESVSKGDALVSPEDSLDLARKSLPTIAASDIRARIAERFPMLEASYVLFLPDQAGTPPPADVLAVALPALLADRPGGVARAAPAVEPIGAAPTPGRLTAVSVDPRVGVASAWLSNGARVHYRGMRDADSRVAITASLSWTADDGAPSLEVVNTLLSQPATGSQSAEQVRRSLKESGVDWRAAVGDGMASIEVVGPSSSVRAMMQVVHSVLAEPRVDSAAFERWKWSLRQRAQGLKLDPSAAAFDAVRRATRMPGGPAPWAPDERTIESLALGEVQAWVGGIVRGAGIEAAIVGDVSRNEALDLAAEYLGSLPARSRPARHDEAKPMRGFDASRIEVVGQADHSVVIVGINGFTSHGTDEAGLLLAGRILEARMNRGWVASNPGARPVVVKHLGSPGEHGAPVLLAVGVAPSKSAAALSAVMEESFAALSTVGPDEAELIKARADAVEDFDRRADDIRWWAKALAACTASGREPATLFAERRALEMTTAASLRDAVSRHDPAVCCGAGRLRIIAEPSEPVAP